MLERFTISTSASVNDDVAASPWNRRPYPRRLTALGLAGSAQPQDYGVEIRVEGVRMGTVYNAKGGANTSPDRDTTYGLNIPIPANYLLELLVIAAPTTNDGVGVVNFVP